MKVTEFNNMLVGDDFARTNLYSVEISRPQGMMAEDQATGIKNFGEMYNGAGGEEVQKGLSYMAKSVSVPGKSIGTIDNKRFGPVWKVANDLIMDTVSMTFMLSEDWREHKFFEGWIAGIMGYVGKGTGSTSDHTGGVRQLYTLSYYKDYIGTVNIIPLDRQGGSVTTITLYEAYPTALGPVELTWGDSGEVASFTVTWSFRDWYHGHSGGWWASSDDVEEGTEIDALTQRSAGFGRF